MSLIQRCNRCQNEEAPIVEFRIDNEGDFREVRLPSGWERVCGADLCLKCSTALHEFLRTSESKTLPRIFYDETRPLHPMRECINERIESTGNSESNITLTFIDGNVLVFDMKPDGLRVSFQERQP